MLNRPKRCISCAPSASAAALHSPAGVCGRNSTSLPKDVVLRSSLAPPFRCLPKRGGLERGGVARDCRVPPGEPKPARTIARAGCVFARGAAPLSFYATWRM